ncbi:MAG: AAA family ATPase [Synergistaceae bacterium]|nr:AAA family ATPase [Synergistaceae bacterium]
MQRTFEYEDIRRQVLEFLAKLGIEPYDDSDVVINGELHRFRLRDDKPSEKSGAIIIHTDNWPAGYIQDWRKGIQEYWKYDISGLDDEQRKYFNSEEYRKKCEEQERIARKKREAKQLKAINAARSLWERLLPVPGDHPYLVRKNACYIAWIGEFEALRYNPNTKCLAVPLRNIDGQLISIQWISENGDKTFFKDAGLGNAFWCIWFYNVDENYKGPILIGEGFATMAKVHELTGKPCVAAMSCFRLEKIAGIFREKYPEAKIIIIADNDHETERRTGSNPGMTYAKIVCNSKKGGKPLADDMSYPPFQAEEAGSDWDDYAIIHGDNETAFKLKEDIARAMIPKKFRDMLENDRLRMVNAQELRKKEFAPVKWAVRGFLPSGLSILGAPPKTGKSILALQISLGVAIGGYVLGKIQVEQGDVLYLSLEDNERRLQARIAGSNNIDDSDNISRLTLVYSIPRQHEGGLEFIDWWLSEHPEARLVIIDTLQKFRKQLSNKANVYAEDYDVISEIKKVADKHDVAFLIIHHLKKVRPKDELTMDWIDTFSGSAGIAGSADALFMLKRARSSVNGKLYRTGRDVEEAEFSLKLDGFGWCLDAEAETFVLPVWQKQILDYLKDHPTITPIELMQAYNINENTARSNLQRLFKEGKLEKIGRAQYKLKGQEEK